jgi:hypothetical protein
MDFTYTAYESLTRKLKDNGYNYANYKNYNKYNKSVILRHDVDYDMGRAVEFARFENEICHANSTYFVLLTSDFYNLFSKSNRKILSQIHDMGNDIGLHFDELNYGENEDIVDCINNEIKILEQLVGFGVNAVSMHRPSKKILESNLRLQSGVINSY